MTSLFTTTIGRLRISALLEGTSLIALVFIAVPLKHMFDMPQMVKVIGPIHGALFILYLFQVITASTEFRWKISLTIIASAASFVPFGTYYVDRKIFKNLA